MGEHGQFAAGLVAAHHDVIGVQQACPFRGHRVEDIARLPPRATRAATRRNAACSPAIRQYPA
jgi:hypothetical protein